MAATPLTSAASSAASSLSPSLSSSLLQHEEELSGYLSALSVIRQQLRARRAEDRQQSLASGLLVNQRQEEQQLTLMVEELGDQLRALREQCRRLQDDSAAPTTHPPSATPAPAPAPAPAPVLVPAPAAAQPPATGSSADRQVRELLQRFDALEAVGARATTAVQAAGGGAANAALRRAGAASAERLQLDDNDLKFNCHALLDIVMAEASKRSIEAVEDAATAAAASSSSGSSRPGARSQLPSVRLLTLLQRDLYRKAAMAQTPQDAVLAHFTHHVSSLLEACVSVLQRVMANQSRYRVLEADSPLSLALYQSVVGAALPITLTVLQSLLFRPLFQPVASAILPPLQQLIRCLNAAAGLFPSSQSLDRAYASRPPMSHHSLRVVESPHSYLPSTDDESVVTIPGADYLCLEFDHRCSTERGRDVLDVLDEDRTLVASLDGDSGQWPLQPLLVSGSSLVLRFHAESANPTMRFGYRILVRGIHFPTPSPPLRLQPTAAASKTSQPQPAAADADAQDKKSSDAAAGARSAAATAASPSATADTTATSASPAPAAAAPASGGTTAAAASTAAASAASTAPVAGGAGDGKPSRNDLLAELEKSRLPSPSRDPLLLLHTLPFVFDLLNSACRLLGQCARVLIAGESQSAEEKANSKWLSSPLFSQGFEKDHPTAERDELSIATEPEPPPALPALEPVKADARIPTGSNINAASNVDPANNAQPAPAAAPSQSSPSAATVAAVSSPRNAAAPATAGTESVPLSIGSGVDAAFLASFIDLTAGSAGAKFDALMRKLVRAAGPELMGGAPVKRTVRCFVAALLKHLGLVSTARAFVTAREGELQAKQPSASSSSSSSSSSASQLVDVWKKGGLMHRWIISQRQSLQQLHLARVQQLEAEGKRMTEEQQAAAEKRLDYSGFCSGLFNKALFLLSVRPCLTHSSRSAQQQIASTPGLKLASEVSSTLALTRTLSNDAQLVRSSSSGGRARDGAESFLSLFSVYKTLQHFNLYKARQREAGGGGGQDGDKGDENVVDLLALFVQADIPVSKFTALIAAQSRRAEQKLQAIECVAALLQSLSFSTASIGLLSRLSNPFRAYNGYPAYSHEEGAPVGHHYYAKIESCDFRLRKRVRSAFLSLYRRLADLIRDARLGTALRAVALDCWAIEWLPLDHPELIDLSILQTLHKMAADQQQPPLLRELAAHTLKLLLASQVRFEVENPHQQAAAGQHAENSEEEDDSEDEEDADAAGAGDASAAFVNNRRPLLRLDRLQQQMVDSVFTDLHHAFQSLVQLRQQIAAFRLSDTQLEQQPPSAAVAAAYLQAEDASFTALSTLVSMAACSSAAVQYLASRNVLQLLLIVLGRGSPRLQRSALSLLHGLLRSISPQQLTAMKLSAASDRTGRHGQQLVTASSLLKSLFHSIGLLTYGDCTAELPLAKEAEGRADALPSHTPYDLRTGDVDLSLAAAMIGVVRQMLRDGQQAQAGGTEKRDDAEDEDDGRPLEEMKMKQEEDELKGGPYPQQLSKQAPASHGSWADEVTAIMTAAFASLPALSSPQLSSFQLDTSLAASLSSTASFPSLLLTLASLSIVGGYTDRLRVGGRVQAAGGSSASAPNAAKESGLVVLIDRSAGRVKVLFDHTPGKVIECELSKLRPVSSVPPDSSLLLRFPAVLAAFAAFIESLQAENRAELLRKQRKEREMADKERTEREEEEAAVQREKQAAAPQLITDAPWQCDVCTFLNTSSLRAVCEMCLSPNPLASALAKTPKAAVPSTPRKTPRSLLQEGAEKDDVEQRVAATSVDDFLYHALRSRTLRALCHLLQHGPSSAFLAQSPQLLPALLSLATRPTQLEASIQQLEQREERLLELLLDRRRGLLNDQQRFADRAKGTQLSHSPFRSLSVLLPNSFDLGSSRSISFLSDDCCLVQFSRSKDASVAVIRSNHLVPNSLPAYYFEVTLVEGGAARTDSSAFNCAVGLFRSGMQLKGYPGSSNSYAYSSKGEAMSTSGGRVVRSPYGPPFSTGDVIGCLWNLRRNSIVFTHNGRLVDGAGGLAAGAGGKQELLPAFSSVNGRFYPACWCEADGMKLKANWGQEPFRFDFFSTLPPGYLNSLSAESADTEAARGGARQRTPAEIRRRTQAEELSMISSFPIELCFPESDTRLLTDAGLCFLSEIESRLSSGQQVLYGCYDVAAKQLCYRPGRLVFPAPSPQLLSFTAEEAAVSLRVTSEHRMFVQLDDEDAAGNAAWTGPAPAVMPAASLLSLCHCPPAEQCEHRRASLRMVACAEAGSAPLADAAERDRVQHRLQMDDGQFAAFFELLGFWLGKGCVNAHAVAFQQLTPRELDWLESTLPQCGLAHTDWRQQDDSLQVLAATWLKFFVDEFSGKQLSPFDGSVQRRPLLPGWALMQLTPAELWLVISGLRCAGGDGDCQDQQRICTSDTGLRDQLMQALLHCGFSPFASLTQAQSSIDEWSVSWAVPTVEKDDAACWPRMRRQAGITADCYSPQRDGRLWCVRVDHADHLIFAQRAERDTSSSDGCSVRRQWRPVVVGQCEIALEQKADDMERAVHFLLEHGGQELERMALEAIQQSKMMEEERKAHVLGVSDSGKEERQDVSDDEEDLADWLTAGSAPTPQEQAAVSAGMGGGRGWNGGWTGGAHAAPPQQASAGAAASRRPPSSSPASMLDDEIEQDIPVGVELPVNHRQQLQSHPLMAREEAAGGARRPAAGSAGDASVIVIAEQIKIDDISCGHALTVSEHAANVVMEDEQQQDSAASPDHFLPISRFHGRTGIVGAVHGGQRCVQLLFYDAELGVKHCRWFPITTLCKPQRLWLDPCQELAAQSWRHVAHAYVCNEQALSVRKVRTAILRLFGAWPAAVPIQPADAGRQRRGHGHAQAVGLGAAVHSPHAQGVHGLVLAVRSAAVLPVQALAAGQRGGGQLLLLSGLAAASSHHRGHVRPEAQLRRVCRLWRQQAERAAGAGAGRVLVSCSCLAAPAAARGGGDHRPLRAGRGQPHSHSHRPLPSPLPVSQRRAGASAHPWGD